MIDLDAVLDALVMRPGDTLVIRVAPDVSRQWMDEFKAQLTDLTDRLPDVEAVVIAGAEQLLVYRPDHG